MVKSSVVSVHQARDAALAEAELDRILDDARRSAIADFEEEEDLSNAKVDEAASSGRAGTALSAEKGPKRIDKELEDKIRANALDDMEALVDNLNNPAFKETLEMTLQALSGHSDGVATIEDFMKGQRHRAENATPSHVPEVELDRTVAATMEALSKESADMVGMETAQVENNMIGEFEKIGQKEDFNQIVENMMRQLLARDLMYEPMKLVCEKYPEWLASKVDGLSKPDYIRYGTQYQYFQRIVAVYEREPDNFARLMELLKDLQEYGPVPAEIIKELAPGLEFSSQGMPIVAIGQDMMPTNGVGVMQGLPMPDASAGQCALM